MNVILKGEWEMTLQSHPLLKTIFIGLGILLITLGVIYGSYSIYFTNHFYWKTTINGIKVGGDKISQAQEKLLGEANEYTLELKGRKGESEFISGETINLHYDTGNQLEKLMNSQSVLNWPLKVFQNKALEVTKEITYDETLLKEYFNDLACLNPNKWTTPENARITYEDNHYKILEGDLGNEPIENILYKAVLDALNQNKDHLDLDKANCYKEAEITASAAHINAALTELNQYMGTTITYTFGENTEILDGKTINTWLTVDEHFNVKLNKELVREYIGHLSRSYSTLGTTRTFVTSYGTTVKVSGGDYGFVIDEDAEYAELLTLLSSGKTLTREPIYSQVGYSWGKTDIGNTYVELDLTNQYLWFYKDHHLIAEGSVVTGDVRNNYTTPPGTYNLDYKSRNVILRGPGYASPVSFWMPFNGGIGIHDATWRGSFGGSIYLTNGSHGCVNSPYELAKTIFENIEKGTPIVCYQ